jgi:hypothetical protein
MENYLIIGWRNMTTYWEQMLEMINTADPNICWILSCKLHKSGYMYIHINGILKRAHCAIYEYCVGNIPKKMEVCHKCDNKACFNPNHLFLGTHFDNMRDSSIKGRQRRICTDEQIRQMKIDRQSGMTWFGIADKYKIGYSTTIQYVNNYVKD